MILLVFQVLGLIRLTFFSLDFLIQMVEVEEMPTSILSLCADLVRLVAAKPEERKIVTLSLSIATTFNEIVSFDYLYMFSCLF